MAGHATRTVKCKDVTIRLRLTVEQRAVLKGAAERAGHTLSSFVRVAALREARGS
jgi:uncharacterized protein (DUF1778 family)